MDIIDIDLLLRSDSSSVVNHLRTTSREYGEERVSYALLAAIRSQNLPSALMSTWMSVAHAPSVIREALLQTSSIFSTNAALKRVARFLQTTQWHDMWDALGSTQGLLNIFARLSVDHVKMLTRAIGARGKTSPAKEAVVDDLFKCASSTLFADAALPNPDPRQLQIHYMRLLPSCSTHLIHTLLQKVGIDDIMPHRLLLSHTSMFQDLARQTVRGIYQLPPSLFQSLITHTSAHKDTQRKSTSPMLFTFSLLSELVEHHGNPNVFPRGAFATLCSLVQWARRKKALSSRRDEILSLCIKYLNAFPRDAKHLYLGHDLLLNVARCWSRTSEERFEQHLVTLLKLLPPTATDDGSSSLLALLKTVHEGQRYHLLRLIVLHTCQLDIDANTDLKDDRLVTILQLGSISLHLQEDHALRLLERIMRIRPARDFIKPAWATLLRPSDPNQHFMDCNMLLAYLNHGNNAALNIAQTGITQHQERVSISRDQPIRAFHAESVVIYATLSGSLRVFEDALRWSGRFIRDPLTVKSLFSRSVIGTMRAIDLLSVSPSDWDNFQGIHLVREKIERVNAMLMMLFGFALLALREPSFDASDWEGVRYVFEAVVRERTHFSYWLYENGQLPDNDLYEVIWASTLQLLLHVEKQALDPEHERLGWNNPHGIVSLARYPLESQIRTVTTTQFFDNLAKGRDVLWREYRHQRNSSCAVICEPFPQGLPLQCLLSGLSFKNIFSVSAASFISERVRNIVFMKPSHALAAIPQDNDLKDAIGSFVDSYRLALKLYVLPESNSESQASRYQRAWHHAVNHLSHPGFVNEDQAKTLWQPFFRSFGGKDTLSTERHEYHVDVYPPAPRAEGDPNNVIEWNPQTNGLHNETEHEELPRSCIDCFLQASGSVSVHSELTLPRPRRVSTTMSTKVNIWMTRGLPRWQSVRGDIQEGLLLSAVLYLDSKKISGERQLAKAFPSAHIARYPALYLDAAFLDRRDLDEDSALHLLGRLIRRVPTQLLLNLFRVEYKALQSIDGSNTQLARSERVTIGLLRLLAASDRPELACGPISRILLDRPEASSWHRQIFTQGFMRRLSPKSAGAMMDSLVQPISSRLETQLGKFQTRPSTRAGAVQSHKPSIKVTTVKLMAQMLEHADFIPFSTALGMLRDIFEKGDHADIRTTAVETMLRSLSKCTSDSRSDQANMIIKTLKSVTPLIASFNEIGPLAEDQWKEMEQSQEILDVLSNDARPPLLSALLDTRLVPNLEKSLFRNVIVPAIDVSRANNRRWLRLVLKKHNLDQSLAALALPFTPSIVAELLCHHAACVPGDLFRELHTWIMSTITLMPTTITAEEYFPSTPEVSPSPEGRCWRRMFVNSSSNFSFQGILSRKWQQYGDNDSLAVSEVQQMVKKEMLALLSAANDVEHKRFNEAMDRLQRPGKNSSQEDCAAWLNNSAPLIRELIDHVDSTRTSTWQHDPTRRPPTLPDTFQWQTWLLPYPELYEDAVTAKRWEEFVLAAKRLLNRVLKHRITYHGELETLRNALQSTNMALDGVWALGTNGSFEDDFSILLHVLCVELAAWLLPQVRRVDLEQSGNKGKVKELVRQWRQSEVEAIRMAGVRTEWVVNKFRS